MNGQLAFEAAVLLAALWAVLRSAGGEASVGAEAAFATSCLLVSFHFAGLYERRSALRLTATLPRLLLGVPLALALMAGCARLFGAALRPGTLIACAAVAPLVVVAMRLGSQAGSYGVERVVLLGASPLAVQLAGEMRTGSRRRHDVLGVVDDELAAGTALPPHVRHLGTLQELGRILHETRPDRVVVTLTSRRGRLPVHLLLKARLRGVLVEDGVDAFERLTGKVAIEAVAPSALVFSRDFKKASGQQSFNRGLSLVLSAVCLALLAPALGLIALLIVLDSEGPALFLQDRVGLHGRRFRIFKFRTMRPAQGPVSEWERDNDARITRVGRVLRRFRLDELPQLVNVLRGDMNLVGPRPHPVSNFELFMNRIPYYSLRASVLPGITGWAQIRYGYANGLEEETEKMRYDLYYIKHMAPWLDARILLETLRVVLLGRDASASGRTGSEEQLDRRKTAKRARSRPVVRVEPQRWSPRA